MESKGRIVIVDVTYRFRTGKQDFEAKLTAYLPHKDGFIPDEFLNENMEFFEHVLNRCWGVKSVDRPDYRMASIYCHAFTANKIEESVKERIGKEIAHLRSVVKKNVSVEVPEPEHYEFVV